MKDSPQKEPFEEVLNVDEEQTDVDQEEDVELANRPDLELCPLLFEKTQEFPVLHFQPINHRTIIGQT
eukprot:CAMPEP_0168557534 /NCGR_PEP_ID=MMETSP0413-20121227/9478_1 /TAXON_ID=136452 /ORGANISM="Filamoeba nolandi, Strain NC-AS-23-1" /LENGTH=67 /DNA_ID=CAMNT_0008588575 /DNA_START=619 /DNA_END=819 /DNA_ORIENTATION=+